MRRQTMPTMPRVALGLATALVMPLMMSGGSGMTPIAQGAAGPQAAALQQTTSLPKAVEPEQDGRTLVPQPQQVTWLHHDLVLGRSVTIVTADQPSAGEQAAARDLAAALAEWKIDSHIVAAAQAKGADELRPAIVLGQAGDNPWAKADALGIPTASDSASTPAQPLPAEGYQLTVTDQGVVIAGADGRGVYWAVQTLRQLLARTAAGQVVIRGVTIRDWPDFSIRGLHMFPSAESDRLHAKIIANLMARLKLNTLVLQVDQSQFASHPELWTGEAASRGILTELAKVAADHQIDVIPLVNLFGHMEWAFRNGQNLSFTAKSVPGYAYDPANPASDQFAQEILGEIVDIFHPKYVHIGHDEVRMNGPIVVPGKAFGRVFVDEVKGLHDYLASRGVGTMLWADEAVKPDVFPYLKELPKDIVMVYWNYVDATRYSDIDRLQRLGFRVIAAPWYDPANIQALTRAAKGYNATGMVGTTWAGYFPDMMSVYSNSRQYVAYVLDAEAFWNSQARDVRNLPYDAGDVFRRLVAFAPATDDLDKPGFTVNLRGLANANAAQWLGGGTVSHPINGFNRSRGTDELIVYQPKPGWTSTRTNEWGVEAVVRNGRITEIWGNNHSIPADGFVLSGHGESSAWLTDYAFIGAKVMISGSTVQLISDEQSQPYADLLALPRGQQRLAGVQFDVIDPATNGGQDAIAIDAGSATAIKQLPSTLRIPVNRTAHSLWFLQSLTRRLNPADVIGLYRIVYADGSQGSLMLSYAVNSAAWNDWANYDLRDPAAWAQHNRRLYATRWVNPEPDKPIAYIEANVNNPDTALVLLAVTGVD